MLVSLYAGSLEEEGMFEMMQEGRPKVRVYDIRYTILTCRILFLV